MIVIFMRRLISWGLKRENLSFNAAAARLSLAVTANGWRACLHKVSSWDRKEQCTSPTKGKGENYDLSFSVLQNSDTNAF
jgi:hypothetical protein